MSGELILVVDDSREIVKHLTDYLLPTLGYRAIAALDGEEGLELVRTEQPDLMLLDLNLPKITGLDVLQELAAESAEIPVVLMTGYGSEKDAIEAFRLGIKDYLVKPFTIDEVSETIDRALQEMRLRHDKQLLVERLRRAEGEMRRQIKEMRSLFDMGTAITSSLRLDDVLDRILQATITLTDAERATVWLPDAAGNFLRPFSRTQTEESVTLQNLPVQGTALGQVYRSAEPVRRSAFTGEGIKMQTGFLARAVLFVPMTAHGRVLGVISASNHDAPRTFSERDELLLRTLSDYACIGLENARAAAATEEKATRHLEDLEALQRVTQAITSSLHLDEVARRTIEEIHAQWDIEASSIWLMDESRHQLRVLVNVGTPHDVLSRFRVDVGHGIVGHVAATQEPVLSNDAAAHPHHFGDVDRETGFATRSIICVPLVFNQEVVGALELLNKRDGPFTGADLDRARSTAAVVAIAISNARLFAAAASRQQLLEATLEYNGNPIFIVDSEGILVLLNQEARTSFGLSEDAVGRAAAAVLSQPQLVELLARPLSSGARSRRQELELEAGAFWLATLAPIPGYGRILVLQDITYLKELDTAKSNFVATVSHDLRAPLNSIIGFANALDEVGELNARQETFVARIVDSAQRMTALVTSLLDLARIDARLEQIRQPLDVAWLVRDVLVDLHGEALANEINIAFEVEGEPPSVLADPAQIRQAVSNLVDNAIKYSAPGQTVAIRLTRTDDTLLLSVHDDGRGIPAKDVPRIFDKFYRVKGEEGTAGSGLGLTLVRSVAEAHGGAVSVESVEGEGSTFVFRLPFPDDDEEAAFGAAIPDPDA